MIDFMIVTDDGFNKENPLLSGGATTRLAAVTANALARTKRANVSYFHIPTDMDALSAYKRDDNTPAVALLIRCQLPEMRQAQSILQHAGVKVFFHLADPHVTNTDPAMAERKALHEDMLTNCDGVIATSEANAQVGKLYNPNTFTIPDVLDVPMLDVKRNWLEQAEKPVTITSYGYGLHHAGFYDAACAIRDFAHRSGRAIHYHICTSDKAPLEKITHASASKIDYFDKLTEFRPDDFFAVHMHSPFSVESFQNVMKDSDIVLIPSVPLEEKTEFQKKWFPKKGPVRALQGLGSGCVVIAQEPVPESYQLFKDNDTLISCTTVEEGLTKAFAITPDRLVKMIGDGQAILQSHYAPSVIADRYMNALKDFI